MDTDSIGKIVLVKVLWTEWNYTVLKIKMIRIIVWKLHSIKNKNDSYDCFISNLAKNKE